MWSHMKPGLQCCYLGDALCPDRASRSAGENALETPLAQCLTRTHKFSYMGNIQVKEITVTLSIINFQLPNIFFLQPPSLCAVCSQVKVCQIYCNLLLDLRNIKANCSLPDVQVRAAESSRCWSMSPSSLNNGLCNIIML